MIVIKTSLSDIFLYFLKKLIQKLINKKSLITHKLHKISPLMPTPIPQLLLPKFQNP
jgi:hypothetical protein